MSEPLNIIIPLICAAMGFLVVVMLIPVIRRHALAAGAARTSFHHSHTVPIPRFGGLALAVAFGLIALCVVMAFPADPADSSIRTTIIAGALAMFLLGFWDDVKAIGAKRKLVLQVAIASIVYLNGVEISKLQIPGLPQVYELGITSWAFTVLWLVAITNLINLIDGIDGLAGGICFMLMCLLAYLAWQTDRFSSLVALGMSTALLGFLRFNFPPAKIYMGDGGAYFLGFLIAALTITSSHKGTIAAALTAPLFALALPIIDVTWAIIRRGLNGLPIFRPDKGHIHHRVRSLGFSNKKTVMVLYGLSLVFLILAFFAFWSGGRMLPVLVGLVFFIFVMWARSLGFIQDIGSVGRALGNSIEMRKETRYALTLSNWLLQEAERCHSVEHLWDDFTFMAMKLGFSGATLRCRGVERKWNATGSGTARTMQTCEHAMNPGTPMILELQAAEQDLSLPLFGLLGELAAEAWLKAAVQWQEVHERGFDFDTEAPSIAAQPTRKRFYLPASALPKVGM